MTNKLIYILLIFCMGFTNAKNKEMNKVIMVVLAHPDDEAALGVVLAKYAAAQNKIYLVIACDGRYGVTDHAGIPAGDSLVLVRKKETECSCKIFGIETPVFLGAHDGMGLVEGIGEYFDETEMLKEKLKQKIEEINPGIIITFGPDGDTGHPDHRGISNITTEVILREGWYEKYPLYYIAWRKDKLVSIPQGNMTSLNYIDKKYLNIQIKYSDADRHKLSEALRCFKSQLTEKDMNDWMEAEQKDTAHIFYFRQFQTSTNTKAEF